MDTADPDTATLEELQTLAQMMRTRTKRLYKDAELLWRMGAKLEDMVTRYADEHDTREGTHEHGN